MAVSRRSMRLCPGVPMARPLGAILHRVGGVAWLTADREALPAGWQKGDAWWFGDAKGRAAEPSRVIMVGSWHTADLMVRPVAVCCSRCSSPKHSHFR